MNNALEIHDSNLNEIKKNGSYVKLFLNEAIVHRSDKEPGIDEGTCWVQAIQIKFKNAIILNEPSDIPNQLDYGYFIINGEKITNVIKIPYTESGDIEALFKTFYGNELKISATSIEITEAGKPKYLQKFK